MLTENIIACLVKNHNAKEKYFFKQGVDVTQHFLHSHVRSYLNPESA